MHVILHFFWGEMRKGTLSSFYYFPGYKFFSTTRVHSEHVVRQSIQKNSNFSLETPIRMKAIFICVQKYDMKNVMY